MNAPDGTKIAERVQQEEPCGCTVAAVAMCTGKTYAEVRSASNRDFASTGLQIEDWYDYLFENGFSFYRVWRVTQLESTNHARAVWPPEPFAHLHICSVSSSSGGHAVVMRRDGTVLDPAKEGVFRLSDYEAVYMVLGLFPRSEERERVLREALEYYAAEMERNKFYVVEAKSRSFISDFADFGGKARTALATPAPEPAQPSAENGSSK